MRPFSLQYGCVRFICGAGLAVVLAAGGTAWSAGAARAQSITGLGQFDQTFNNCRVPTGRNESGCNDAGHEGHDGGKGNR